MKCQVCSSPATVHVANLVNGKKHVTHLCQRCAEEQELLKQDDLNLPALLQALIGQHAGQWTQDLARLTCPACGIKYMEFRNSGRLGCPNDYDVFRAGLSPLLERIHRSRRHVGKAPRRRADQDLLCAVVDLRRRLKEAVDDEDYEEAARLRDLLREKEATDEPG
jgi:protein arginine kinase activator